MPLMSANVSSFEELLGIYENFYRQNVKHHPGISDLLDHRISGDADLMMYHRIGLVSFPFKHVITDCHTDSFEPAPFGSIVTGIAVGIIKHHKGVT